MKALVVLCGLAGFAAVRAPAQQRVAYALRGDLLMAWVHADTGLVHASLRGPALGGEGRVTLDPWVLGIGLVEGRLRPQAGTTLRRDLVQGTVYVGARPLPWLEVSAGPVIRAYVSDSSTERWVVWHARARVEAPIVAGSIASSVELWRSLSSQVNLPAAALRSQGGEAGLLVQPPGRPFWVRLAYRLDDAQLGGGGPGGHETFETLALSLGWAVR